MRALDAGMNHYRLRQAILLRDSSGSCRVKAGKHLPRQVSPTIAAAPVELIEEADLTAFPALASLSDIQPPSLARLEHWLAAASLSTVA